MVGDETNRRYLKNAAMGLLMRCLDHTDQTVAITSVIGIAKHGCTPVNPEWTSLLCKCILKSTKTLRGASPQPNYSAVALSCHEFLCTMPARQRKLDADAAMRFRALKLLVNELSSMDAVDLSQVPLAMDQGELGIRGLLRQLGNSVAAGSSMGAAAPVAAPAPEKLSASGWRLPVQEVPVPADVAPAKEGVEPAKPVESVSDAENAEWTELQRLVERLLEEKCAEDNTINDLHAFVSKYPDTDVDAALEDGLPEAMLELVRTGLARVIQSQLPRADVQSEAHQDEVREETGTISRTNKDSVRTSRRCSIMLAFSGANTNWHTFSTSQNALQDRIAALKESAPAEASAAAAKSPLAPRSVNSSNGTSEALICFRSDAAGGVQRTCNLTRIRPIIAG
jgi:hypothetical protein